MPAECEEGYLRDMGGQHLALPTTHNHPTPPMTKLQQHKNAMEHGGYSPYFGWVIAGRQVSENDYRNITDRADQAAEKGGALWS